MNRRAASRLARLWPWGRVLAAALLAVASPLLLCCRPPPPPTAIPELDPLKPADRVMILAPHEDDETLGAGGVIQQAVAAGLPVRIVYLTCGDHNELAFMVYRKRPWLSPTINRNMGEVRRREAITAAELLGLAPEQLVFLGYPDHDTLDIWKHHWGKSEPLHSVLTNARKVPYKEAFSFEHPHKGEAILADLRAQLEDFRPTRVFAPHPVDGNPDHRSCWLFLEAALLDERGQLPRPRVLAYPVHAGRWPQPGGEHTDLRQTVPPRLAECPGAWRSLELTAGQAALKAAAIRLYKSQTSVRAGYLLSFARRNEVFARLPATVLRAPEEGANGGSWLLPPPAEFEPEADGEGAAPEPGPVGRILWHDAGAALHVEFHLRAGRAQPERLTLYAFGDRRDKPFPDMPKVRLEWDGHRLRAWDQSEPASAEGAEVSAAAGRVILRIPWKLLGDPDALFVEAEGPGAPAETARTGWQLLERPGRR